MTGTPCAAPLSSDVLVDYALGELPPDEQAAVEDHVFACEACGRELESAFALGTAIAASVARGDVTAAVSADLLVVLQRRGVQVRRYHLVSGQSVACTIAPGDHFVAVSLDAMPSGVTEVTVDVDVLDRAAGTAGARHIDGVPVDATTNAAVMLFPGPVVRAYPRSRWIMTARGQRGDGAFELGPFTMEHTPWDDRPGEP